MRQLSNYPPGTGPNDPNAPWNWPDRAECFTCRKVKEFCDMSIEEAQSVEDNDDGSFLCDICATEVGDDY